jgi:hypothetical protein
MSKFKLIALIISVFLVILISPINLLAEESKFLTLPMNEEPFFYSSFADHSGWITSPTTGRGIDYAMNIGTDIIAAADGEVSRVEDGLSNLPKDDDSYSDGYGNYIKIIHEIDGSTWMTIYAHLSPSCLVKEGDKVRRGQIIAQSGHNGYSTGPHLHFEVRKDNINIDPYDGDNNSLGKNYLWITNPPSHGFDSSLQVLNIWSTTHKSKGPWIGSKEVVLITYRVENQNQNPITAEKFVLALHDLNNNHLHDFKIPGTDQVKFDENITINSGKTYKFYDAELDLSKISAGNYKVIAKAYIDSKWQEIGNEGLTVLDQQPALPTGYLVWDNPDEMPEFSWLNDLEAIRYQVYITYLNEEGFKKYFMRRTFTVSSYSGFQNYKPTISGSGKKFESGRYFWSITAYYDDKDSQKIFDNIPVVVVSNESEIDNSLIVRVVQNDELIDSGDIIRLDDYNSIATSSTKKTILQFTTADGSGLEIIPFVGAYKNGILKFQRQYLTSVGDDLEFDLSLYNGWYGEFRFRVKAIDQVVRNFTFVMYND